MSYAEAMAREKARLNAAHRRNYEHASVHGEAQDDVEAAWDHVFEAKRQEAPDEEAEAKRRKLARKVEKRVAKQAQQHENAAQWSVYVSGIPQDISYTAVHSLFSRVGNVRKVKLYKDDEGNQKGDGIVIFSSEAGVKAALEKSDWALFGELLLVQPATFTAKPAVPKEDWARVIVLCGLFTQEDIGMSGDAKGFINRLEEEVWLECATMGTVERVTCFAADNECPVVVRFEQAESASLCIATMEGRWFNECKITAARYDGHKKRVVKPEVDEERQRRLVPPPPSERPSTAAAAAGATASSAAATAPAAAGAPPPPPPPPEPLRLPNRSFVKLRGLQKAAERNGQVGLINSFDEARERYMVQLREGGTILALRADNLLQMLKVKLEGLEGGLAQHEGEEATLFEYDAESCMYGAELGSGEALPVSTAQVVLPDGACASVCGLVGAAQYNGSLARVLEYVRESGRYVVEVAAKGGKQLRLKKSNLRA